MDMEEESTVTRDQGTASEVVLFLIAGSATIAIMDHVVQPRLAAVFSQVVVAITIPIRLLITREIGCGHFLANQ